MDQYIQLLSKLVLVLWQERSGDHPMVPLQDTVMETWLIAADVSQSGPLDPFSLWSTHQERIHRHQLYLQSSDGTVCLVWYKRQGRKVKRGSDLPRPLHSFPNWEIDKDPGECQSAHQGPAKLPRLLQTARKLVHVAPAGTYVHTQLHEITFVHTHSCISFTRPADLLPELSDCAGQVGGVCQAVVGETFVCVPGVVTALPRKLLHTTHRS